MLAFLLVEHSNIFNVTFKVMYINNIYIFGVQYLYIRLKTNSVCFKATPPLVFRGWPVLGYSLQNSLNPFKVSPNLTINITTTRPPHSNACSFCRTIHPANKSLHAARAAAHHPLTHTARPARYDVCTRVQGIMCVCRE